jgi:hypothetical protein
MDRQIFFGQRFQQRLHGRRTLDAGYLEAVLAAIGKTLRGIRKMMEIARGQADALQEIARLFHGGSLVLALRIGSLAVCAGAGRKRKGSGVVFG